LTRSTPPTRCRLAAARLCLAERSDRTCDYSPPDVPRIHHSLTGSCPSSRRWESAAVPVSERLPPRGAAATRPRADWRYVESYVRFACTRLSDSPPPTRSQRDPAPARSATLASTSTYLQTSSPVAGACRLMHLGNEHGAAHQRAIAHERASDGGHGNLPVGGRRKSPLAATGSRHGWPRISPAFRPDRPVVRGAWCCRGVPGGRA
jgi:hypothetical protein